ncbi:hypothetical protein Csa_012824, partial [Cucumis sativus]
FSSSQMKNAKLAPQNRMIPSWWLVSRSLEPISHCPMHDYLDGLLVNPLTVSRFLIIF